MDKCTVNVELAEQPSKSNNTGNDNKEASKIQETFGKNFSILATEEQNSRKSSISEEELFLPSSRISDINEYPPMINFFETSNPRINSESAIHPTMTDGTKNDEVLQIFEETNIKIIRSQLKPSKVSDESSGNNCEEINHPKEQSSSFKDKAEIKKFGWFEGVFVRCCANTFGVMLYLRMAWVAGQAGILMGSMIVLLGALIVIITALSMSAICTNGLIKGGGAYYLISRSLGPQFGGAIGIIFSIANAVAVAMYIVGFAETLVQILGSYGIHIIDGNINDVRIIGILTCIILLAIIFIGLGFEAKMQIILLIIIIASIINFYIGCIISPSDEKVLKGMTGFKSTIIKKGSTFNTLVNPFLATTFIENFYPSFRDHYHFASVFAIYFPAATGIMAGANISGDLKNSARAIPKGTILAIFLTTIVYLSIVWISGATVIRDADGFTFPIFLNSPTAISNDGWWISSIFSSIFGNGTQYYAKPDCAFSNNETCKYGIMNDSQVFNLIGLWSPLVTAGLLTSTLSSALLSLVSAPKIFQAVAQDNIFPYIGIFSTGFRKNSEPQKAYILAFIISCLVILIGNLNAIALIISNFYLSTYALINFACFDTSFAKSPGFRPSFKFYHQWISLAGAIVCVCVMFIISYLNALITFLFFGLLFFYMAHRKPNVNWGTAKQAHAYRHAFQYIQKLEKTNEHVKNWRPQILVLTGNPASRPALIDFAHAITKGNSLLICGHIIPHNMSGNVNILIQSFIEQIKLWFISRHLKAFYFPVANSNFRQGFHCLLQGSGLGRLKPNIVLIGFKRNWNITDGTNELNEINDYFNVIIDAYDFQIGVCILRNGKDGFDLSQMLLENGLSLTSEAEKNVKKSEEFDPERIEMLTLINQFHFNIEKGTIDVWWLYDDGGLSLLLPYLLTQSRSYLKKSKLRIFTLSTESKIIDEEKLAALLSKFRIKFCEITIIKDNGGNPKAETIQEFEKLIKPFCVREYSEFQEGMIQESELKNNEEKTMKILELAEHLQNYSSKTDLIVITLPAPIKKSIGSCLYMAWMDMMSRNLPPTLFVCGNLAPVLTLYS